MNTVTSYRASRTGGAAAGTSSGVPRTPSGIGRAGLVPPVPAPSGDAPSRPSSSESPSSGGAAGIALDVECPHCGSAYTVPGAHILANLASDADRLCFHCSSCDGVFPWTESGMPSFPPAAPARPHAGPPGSRQEDAGDAPRSPSRAGEPVSRIERVLASTAPATSAVIARVGPATVSFARRISGPWLLYLAAPVAVFLSVLFGVSLLVEREERFDKYVSSKFLDSRLPHLPPPGLEVGNTYFRTVDLEKGGTVRVLSGEVSNKTDRAWEGVTVQGLAYDRSGVLITSAEVPLDSPIVKARLRTLTAEMIADLQNGGFAGPLRLRPGESAPFVIAFVDGESARGRGPSRTSLESASFYSARVYSVR